MFPYTVKYTESEYDIKNNDLLYKTDPTHQNTFELLEMFGNNKKLRKCLFILYYVQVP